MIHIDSKITIWDRFSIPDDKKEELMQFLKENPKATASDILDWASDLGYAYDHTTLTDTGSDMTPEENDGQSTLEVVEYNPDGSNTTIFSNEIKEEPETE